MRTKPTTTTRAKPATKKGEGTGKPAASTALEPSAPEAADAFEAAAAPTRGAPAGRIAGAQVPKSSVHEAELKRYFLDVQREQWQFYADNTGASTNHLPPDNVRVDAGKPIVVDARTSPTNIGLYMLSAVTAQRLGIVDQPEVLRRLRDTVETLKQLPKYQDTVVDAAGKTHAVEHLYNWYSTDGQPREIGGGFVSAVDNGNFVAFLLAIITAVKDADPALASELKDMAQKMRFDVFYDKDKGLLHHGGNVANGRLHLTQGHYDTLISEARSAYAVAIMLGQIPKEAWRNLKPKLDQEIDGLRVNKEQPMQAYTGTMFEYLTPRLLMKHDGTPLGKADEQAVFVQMNELSGGIWGKSEANSNTSQGYAAYGARGLSQSKEFLPAGLDVIAPYASQMATALAPDKVKENLEEMSKHGLRGKYGFFESATVRPQGDSFDYQVCRQFFAHHIGMGLIGSAALLLDDVVTDWFHGSEFNKNKTLESLLNTRVSAYRKPDATRVKPAAISNAYAYEPQLSYDKAEIIGNGRFVSNVKAVGGSSWAAESYALSNNEVFYLRDNQSGQLLPIKLDAPDRIVTSDGGRRFEYDVKSPGGGKLGIAIDIAASAESRVKVSRVIVDNQTGRDQDLAVTGYLDWIMDDVNAYLSHPVYRNLYVETEHDQQTGAVIARRRTMQGAEQDRQPFGFFAVAGGAADWADSSRTNILGRLGSLAAPRAVIEGGLSSSPGEFGATLDPAAALSKGLKVPKGERREVAFVFGIADDRAAIPGLIKLASAPAAAHGVPHYPPDTSHKKMLELAARTDRASRIQQAPATPRPAQGKPGAAAHHFEDGGRTLVVTDPFALKKPWSMVASNGRFGFVATAAGWAYSFGVNSQQNRITPYVPDNTTELPLRGVIVKDKVTGESFSITPNPAPSADGSYQVEMSPGSIRYLYQGNDGLSLSMTQFVAAEEPCELWKIDVENGGGKDRQLELSSFLKWALGANSPGTDAQTKVSYDAARGVVFAESPDSILKGSVAFHALVGDGTTQKAASKDLYGTATDPFSGLSLDVSVAKGEKKQLAFVLGQAVDKAEALRVLDHFRSAQTVGAELKIATDKVSARLDGLQVKTPDASLDTMLNTWLPYQAYDAHFLARSGFYQSGGAYGFRDQLQTVTNLLDSGNALFKEVARGHIIESARHQFVEGDVQHWWHPHNNFGQRSTITDNLLWLPYALAHYAEVTGDATLLDEQAPFSVGRKLNPGELDYCESMAFSDTTASMYQHGKKAVDLVLTRIGAHGLPLIGKGDWNDGLDRVGHLGRGESVWLGFFLYDVLNKYAGVAEQQRDPATATRYRAAAVTLKANIEKHGWDNGHYARAYADDGEKVDFNDAIVQSWAVLSGAASAEHGVAAVASAVHDLYDADTQTILLFDKVLDKEAWGGSLAAYPNGLRENNAQYTHGSSWLPRAVAKLGDGDWAMKLLHAMLPTQHAADPRYGAEPNVVAADIYGGSKKGEGGWTWYSGGPGWIYRTSIELILGLQFKNADKLFIDPCIPRSWPSFQATHQQGSSQYTIDVSNPEGISKGVKQVRVDGVVIDASAGVHLKDDGRDHRIEVVMGQLAGTQPFSLAPALAALAQRTPARAARRD